jgi:hypothetical protein
MIPAGQTFHLVASGTGLIDKNNGRALDAEYAQRPSGVWADASNGGADWGIRGIGASIDWKANGFQTDHVYGTTISAGATDTTFALFYSDDYYNDNVGVLSVAVYAPAPEPTTEPPIDKPTEGEPCQKCQAGVCQIDLSTGETNIYSGTTAAVSGAGMTPPVRLQLNQTATGGIGGAPSSGEFGTDFSRSDTARLTMLGPDPDAPEFVTVAFSSTDTRVFRRFSDGTFARVHGLGSTDTLSLEGTQYVFRTASGTTRTFNSFSTSLPEAARGSLATMTDASGNRIEYSFGIDGSITSLSSFIAGQASAVEIQDYVHLPVGNPNAGKVGQGQRQLNRWSCEDFEHESRLPTAGAAFHGEASFAGMLFE